MKKNSAGSWVIDIRDQRLRGGRITLSTRTSRKPDARRREAAVRALLDQGELELIERLRRRGDPLRIDDLARAHEDGDLERVKQRIGLLPLTLAAAADALLERVTAEGLAEETRRQYEIVLRLAREDLGEDRDIGKISPEEWKTWLTGPKATNRGEPWSHNRRVLASAVINRLYVETIGDELHAADDAGRPARITRNPLDRVPTPQYRATRVEFLREPEWAALFGKVEGTPRAAFLALGCLAGLRISETANLRTDIDVILDGDRPRIEIQPRTGEFAWKPKGWPRHKRSARTIPLASTPSLLEILREHVRLGFAGDAYFIRLPGKDRPLPRQTLADWTREAFEAAGIRYGRKKDALTYHSLRHTFISWLVQDDYSLMKIEKLAGTSVRMIQDVYGHLVDEDLDRGMGLIERRLAA